MTIQPSIIEFRKQHLNVYKKQYHNIANYVDICIGLMILYTFYLILLLSDSIISWAVIISLFIILRKLYIWRYRYDYLIYISAINETTSYKKKYNCFQLIVDGVTFLNPFYRSIGIFLWSLMISLFFVASTAEQSVYNFFTIIILFIVINYCWGYLYARKLAKRVFRGEKIIFRKKQVYPSREMSPSITQIRNQYFNTIYWPEILGGFLFMGLSYYILLVLNPVVAFCMITFISIMFGIASIEKNKHYYKNYVKALKASDTYKIQHNWFEALVDGMLFSVSINLGSIIFMSIYIPLYEYLISLGNYQIQEITMIISVSLILIGINGVLGYSYTNGSILKHILK